MVLVKGDRSRIAWANKAFRDYYGMSNEQLRQIIDAPFNEAENTKQYVIDDRHVYTTGQTLNIPAEKVTRHDGVVQLFNTVKSPLRDLEGRTRLTVGVSRDITAQKEAEEQLAHHREQLETLVSERTGELREISERLQVIRNCYPSIEASVYKMLLHIFISRNQFLTRIYDCFLT